MMAWKPWLEHEKPPFLPIKVFKLDTFQHGKTSKDSWVLRESYLMCYDHRLGNPLPWSCTWQNVHFPASA